MLGSMTDQTPQPEPPEFQRAVGYVEGLDPELDLGIALNDSGARNSVQVFGEDTLAELDRQDAATELQTLLGVPPGTQGVQLPED